MPLPRRSLAILLLLLAGGVVIAWATGQGQSPTDSVTDGSAALTCRPPSDFRMPRVRRPAADDVRRTPVTRYTLALSWSPQFCAEQGRWAEADSMQCSGRAGRFGFILHGLWPETQGRNWPQYCRPARAIPRETLRQHLCMTPSPDLLQHEWERHGTCMSATPEAYFEQAAQIHGRVTMPDMAGLIRDGGTAGAIRQAFSAVNVGLEPNMIAVMTDGGWLEEVRLCLDRRFAYTACPPAERGAADGARIRVARVAAR